MKKFSKLTALVLAGLLVLTGCGAPKSRESESKAIRVGLIGPNLDEWEYMKEKMAKQGIEIEIVEFTDYNQPNEALTNKDIDLNAFQHYIFLEAYNEDRGGKLVAIGDTFIAPLGIYSQKIKDVSEIKEGDAVAIPNDPTNGGRALILLQTAGLLKVDEAAGLRPTIHQITENPLNLKIQELDASQTARALPDVAVSVINNDMAVNAGMIPTQDAIFLEPVNDSSKPYVNLIAAREEDKDNETFRAIVKAYQEDDTAKVIEEVSKGSKIPAWK